MESYFFIPATKQKFIRNIPNIPASYFVFDFEDSIDIDEVAEMVEEISAISKSDKYYARLYWNKDEKKESLRMVDLIIQMGFSNFIIPKVQGKEEADFVLNYLNQNVNTSRGNNILLVEHPRTLIELPEIIKSNNLYGLALGSHDYCSEIGMKHSIENFGWARDYLLNLANAYNLLAIDIATMNLSNKEVLISEIQNGFDKGFDGKFFIHPFQIDVFVNNKYFSKEEHALALKVKKYIESIGGEQNFVITKIDDVIVERPHLKRIKKILNTSSDGSF